METKVYRSFTYSVIGEGESRRVAIRDQNHQVTRSSHYPEGDERTPKEVACDFIAGHSKIPLLKRHAWVKGVVLLSNNMKKELSESIIDTTNKEDSD